MPASVEADKETLRKLQVAWGEDWAKRDAESMIARYAPDASLFFPFGEAVRGLDAIAPFIRMATSDPNSSLAWTVDDVQVAGSGELGVLTGRYVQHNPNPDGKGFSVETGRYATTYAKIDGRWLATMEINTPAPVPHDGLPMQALKPSAG